MLALEWHNFTYLCASCLPLTSASHSFILSFMPFCVMLAAARRPPLTLFHVENTSRAISEEDFEN